MATDVDGAHSPSRCARKGLETVPSATKSSPIWFQSRSLPYAAYEYEYGTCSDGTLSSPRVIDRAGGDGELVSQTGRSVSEVHDAKLSGPVDESSAMDNPLKGQAFQLDGAVDT